jgi:tripartite-type tricarboxylate transporter receptor subunit TctC
MFEVTQYPTRRRLFKMASLALTSCAFCASTFAQSDYPSKPIKLVVPYATGGVSDAVGRVLALALGKALQQTVIVENRGGAGGTLGAGLVAKAPADGYTILLTSPPMVAVAPALIRDLPYRSAEDFTPIGTVIVTPNVLVVNNELPVKTIAELITYGKGPGKGSLSFASAGPGSTGHLSGQIMMTTTGISMTHIPYKSSGQAFPDVISGRVSMVFDSLPSTIGFIRSGRVKPLLVMSEKRSTVFPDVQTAAEAGFPAATMNFWMGIEGPAKLPQDIVNKLNTALKVAVNSPEMSQQMQTLGAEPYLTSPEEFKAQRNNDIAKYGKLVKEMGLKQE